ncbi:YgaP family membrane protein [Fervidibacillus albus]|uniref:DUF2892 domain-containing protein n=1 Tax=Fervidibacillus albus TaxID=2980026 RepID=A0A9E8LWL6_9BACI|nr:DUF2892 domain-containing protein [Fervidibacillus albus]WAA11020.1 DUF2892 domain-containing protein [Fervidibacillus albus]
MKANVGTVDRMIRIIIGLVLLSLLYFIEGNWKWIGFIGIVPIVTAFVKFCPLYTLFGISTCPVKNK